MTTLSDRLAAAARARGEVVVVRRPPVEEIKVEEPEPEPVDPRRVVAAATTPATTVTPDRSAALDSICPTCGRTGDLGVVDLVGHTADWTCIACGTLWQVGLDAPADTSV